MAVERKARVMKATVSLWRGQYRNDGLERIANLSEGLRLHDVRLVGEASDWFLLADMHVYEPDGRHATRRAA